MSKKNNRPSKETANPPKKGSPSSATSKRASIPSEQGPVYATRQTSRSTETSEPIASSPSNEEAASSPSNEEATSQPKKQAALPPKQEVASSSSKQEEALPLKKGGGVSSSQPQAPQVWDGAVVSWGQWWKSPSVDADGSDDRAIQFALVAVSLLLFTTQLGYGFWDCWEPHYAETARMMIVRKDWVHPYWSYAYFLSKPALMFWYTAASMSVFGINEWAARLPFALHAVLLVWGVYVVLARLYSSRVGVLAAVITATAPLTGFLGRQALSDILVVTYLTLAMGFLALALFGSKPAREEAERTGRRPPVHLPYLTFFYALIGLSLLAKGLLGLGIAGAVFVGYLLFTFDLDSLRRLHIPRGAVLAGVIALPWYIHMSFFPGRNIDDHKTFWDRFVLHDNFYRVFGGVHGERGDFVYFVRQLGYGLGPWLAFLPMGLFGVARFRGGDAIQGGLSVHEQLRRFLLSWWFVTFVFLTLSQTKFHHYVFPVIPISAILIALWIDRYLSEPFDTTQRFALIAIFGILAMVMRDFIHEPKNLVNLFVYKYERAYPAADTALWSMDAILQTFGFKTKTGTSWALTPPFVFRNLFVLFGFALAVGFFYEMRKAAIALFCAAAMLLAIYNTHVFLVRLSQHWSQKPLFETLQKHSPLWKRLLSDKRIDARQHPIPEEPLFAFKMNWRGEQFYALNHDLQIMGTNAYARLYDAIQRHRRPGRPVFFLTEAERFDQLKRGVGSYDAPLLRVIDKSNNKYILVKLLPRSAPAPLDLQRLERDKRNREYYDNWVRDWQKKQRLKNQKK